MAKYQIRFQNQIKNDSLQVNDYVYAVSTGSAISATDLVGRVSEIRNANFIVDTDRLVDDSNGLNPTEDGYIETKQAIVGAIKTPSTGDFIMFRKDNRVNNCSLKGYYAEVTLTNTGADKKELFSLGSEITESSK
tara:strand:- start:1092 stop:1496 length:405 start_codon:yes stop_codon:yes gene_type:complete